MTSPAFILFVLFVLVTLGITVWASRRGSSRDAFYTAGGHITGFQNGLAFAGDALSAAALLGVVGLYYTGGLDGVIYGIGALIGWPALLFLMADRMRRSGHFTVADALATRLAERPIRVFLAVAQLAILVFYMVSQVVAAGLLVQLLLGGGFGLSALIVGGLMLIYVVFGGMTATTWVQIVKATLLLIAVALVAVLVLARFHFDPDAVIAAAIAKQGPKVMQPGGLVVGVGGALSLGLSQVFGPAGLPHVLMRFFTVPSAKEARKSAFVATLIIGVFALILVIVGYGAVAILTGDPAYTGANGVSIKGGSNMVALHLARALGGDLLLGFVAAVSFATILAVVSGVTLTAAATLSHDLYARVIRRGVVSEREELTVSRVSALVFGAVCIALAFAFKDQNVTFLSAFAFAVAASATFPLLFLGLFWSRLTTAGALAGGVVGLTTAIVALVLGPSVWVSVLHFAKPVFPYQYPTVLSMPLAFAVAVAVSLATREPIRNADVATTAPDTASERALAAG